MHGSMGLDPTLGFTLFQGEFLSLSVCGSGETDTTDRVRLLPPSSTLPPAPSPCSFPLPHHLIRPKRFTREEIRWRSPGLCWGSKLLQHKNTRSVEQGKADVRGTGRLAIKT